MSTAIAVGPLVTDNRNVNQVLIKLFFSIYIRDVEHYL